MKLEVTQENLAKALGMVTRIVGVKSTLPVLNNVLLATEKGRLRLSATDLEIGVTTWIGAKIAKEGSFTVPARLFGDFIMAARGKTISISREESLLKISTGPAGAGSAIQSEAQIKGIVADEFPLIPEIKKDPLLRLSPLLLKEALKKVVVAAAVDETRPALSGVLFWREGQTLRLASTDSYRLAEVQLDLRSTVNKQPAKAGEQPTKIIVPLRTTQELVRILESGDDEVALAVSDNQALFKTASFTLVSRLIEGEFPNYLDIIPKQGITTLTLESEELLGALKVASLFAREVANNITLSAEPKDALVVRATSPQVGENKVRLPAKGEGEAITVAFNARFLVDAVSAISSKNIEIMFTGKTTPAVFREEGNPRFLHLIMPLRVEE